MQLFLALALNLALAHNLTLALANLPFRQTLNLTRYMS